jgi:hypothetical protein
MKISRFLCASLFLLLAAAAVFAADPSGKWVAQIPGRGGQTRELTINLKADGGNLTGSVTTMRGDAPISEGKIDGDNVSFAQVMNFNGSQIKLIYKGKISGDEIKFTREREGGNGQQVEFTAKRGS